MRNEIRILDTLDASGDDLRGRVSKALAKEAFNNRHTLHPRRFGEIAASIVTAYADYLRSGSPTATVELGRSLSLEGVGLKSVRSVFGELRDHCWRTLDDGAVDAVRAALESTEGFIFALIEGTMAGREGYILQEQERLYRAVSRAQARDASMFSDPEPAPGR